MRGREKERRAATEEKTGGTQREKRELREKICLFICAKIQASMLHKFKNIDDFYNAMTRTKMQHLSIPKNISNRLNYSGRHAKSEKI